MNPIDKSIFAFALYMILVVGVGLMSFPTLILDMFQLSYGDDTWIRFVGMLAFILGFYYVIIARNSLEPLYRWTVIMRLFAVLFMVAFFATGKLGAGILGFAVIDLAGAGWTWMAMRAKN